MPELPPNELVEAMEECERDTIKFVSPGAAARLAKWHQHRSSKSELIEYIQRTIRGKKADHGFTIDKKGGLSLERIALDRCPELFTDDDKRVAARTLGRK